MSKTSCKVGTKKIGSKTVKRIGKGTKSKNSKMIKITVLPIEAKDPPYVKWIPNKNNENNLKLVWPKEDLLKIYANILKSKEKISSLGNKVEYIQPKSPHNFSVYTK